jgi:preprotein translocase subunit SecG
MNMLTNLVVALQILAALVMIGLVLVQHGKGADMGASFGSGASGSVFGASGSANFLSRSTAVCATVFFCCTIFLAYISNSGGRSDAQSILDKPSISASSPEAANLGGSSQIPGAATGLATDSSAPAQVADKPASGAAAIPSK